MEDAHAGMTIFFENYYPISKVEGFYIKKLSLEFLIFLRHNNFFLKMKTFFRHKPKLLVLRTLWMFVKFLKFVAENPRIPFYPFIFLYHENMEFRVFCGIFNEIFKKFQILFFPYMKLQLLINNVFIIFDNCAFKIQNSKKPRFWTVSYGQFLEILWCIHKDTEKWTEDIILKICKYCPKVQYKYLCIT